MTPSRRSRAARGKPYQGGAVALVSGALATPVFVLDLLGHHDLALTVLYAGAVLYALRAPGRVVVLGVATFCTVLSLIGAVISPLDGVDWLLIAQHRAIGILAIWTTAFAGLRQQSELLESERRFRSIFNSAQDPVFVYEVTPEGRPLRFLEANEAAARTYGYTREELRGMGPAQLVTAPGIIERLPGILAQMRREGSALIESEHRAKDGRRILVEVRSQLIEFGAREAVLSIVRDIAERKQMEAALRASEQRERARADDLEALMDAVPAVVFFAHDPECRRVTGNRAAYELLGVADGNVSQSAPEGHRPPHFKSYAAEDGRELQPHELPVQRAAAGEEFRGYEEHVVFDDGEEVWIYGNAVPLRDEAGRLRGALAAAVDVTERKQAEQRLERLTAELEERVAARTAELAESAKLYRTIGEQIEYGIWITNPDGGVRYLSESFLDLLGMSHEEAAEFGWAHRLPPRVLTDWRETVATRDRWDCEFQVRGRDGRYRTILSRGLPVRDGSGRVTAWAGINLDITERKADEQRLQQLSVQLSQAEHREREKLGRILHDDIQQMLVAAKVRVGLLKNAEPESMLAEVDRVSGLLDETIESTRTLSHELSPQILQTAGLAEALDWLTTRKYEKYGLHLLVEADSSAAPTEDLKILLFQAVRELLLNVVKHASVSDAQVTLVRHGGAQLCITVSDKGSGFDAEAERARSGAGAHLGLFGIHERLAALGGSMEVDSSPGHGTTVRLFAPLAGVAVTGARSPPGV